MVCHRYTLNMQASSGTKNNSSPNEPSCTTVTMSFNGVKLTSYGTVRRNFRYALPVTVSDELLREAWKKCNRNIPNAARSLQGRLHFKISLGSGTRRSRTEEVTDEPRSGRPTTVRTEENVDRVCEVLHTDCRLSIQQIADTLHMSTFAVHGIVAEDLQMRKVCAKLVPKVLTQDQKKLKSFALSRIVGFDSK
ncbi:FLJ37770-like protein [Trichonephila clavipes]|nr:FLJ37770-like protein [Trichonephila clavipes]